MGLDYKRESKIVYNWIKYRIDYLRGGKNTQIGGSPSVGTFRTKMPLLQWPFFQGVLDELFKVFKLHML